MDIFHALIHRVRYMFYLVGPSESSYEKVSQVPRFVVEMFPFFVLLGFLEQVVRFFQGKPIMRVNDTVASLSQGILQECFRIKVRSIEIIVYCFVYDNFRFFTLPWNSAVTWWLCFFAIDLGFYWAHRIAHEVNFIWAIHQAHHNSEEFYLTSALRQAVLQPFTAWITYVPLALSGIPPSIFLPHLQMGELFMFWVHTEIIDRLGPLEYIINTPSHHRVHHARNRKYIDKNYAGVLIIWDRIFGTFQPEEEEAVYGLTKPCTSFNPFHLQLHHWNHMFKTAKHVKGIWNKIFVFIKGPGWSPGKPRLGYREEIPEIEHPVQKYDPYLPLWCKAYVVLHFAMIVLCYHDLSSHHQIYSQIRVTLTILYLVFSVTSMGFLMDNRIFAPALELVRCLIFFSAEYLLLPSHQSIAAMAGSRQQMTIQLIRSLFISSAVLWSVISLHTVSVRIIKKKIH